MRNRCGISPLLASVLLVVIVVGLAGFIGGWMKFIAKQQTEELADTSEIGCSYATINVDEVVYSAAEKRMIVRVRASGTRSVNIDKVVVVNESYDIAVYRNGANFSLGTLSPGDIGYIVLDGVPPSVKEVRVVPRRCGMNAVSVERDYFIIQ